jgi:uncharacterized membrane protein
MVRKDETMELDMSVDEALKYVVSMGVVAPTVRGRGPAAVAASVAPSSDVSSPPGPASRS